MIADNSTKMMPSGRRGAVRSGAALLAGLLRCGHCGRKLTVSYCGTGGAVLRYACRSGMINHNEPKCISFVGMSADEAVGREIVRILEPIGLEAALRVIEDDAETETEAVRQHEIAHSPSKYSATQQSAPATKPIARGSSTMPSTRGTGRWRANWSAVERAPDCCADG